nr:hypothetical protein [Cladosporium ramotenellum polymycovirus 1]WEW73479.1 hypothetical protein [Cladosporium ramotenellum polymycovirus 1]
MSDFTFTVGNGAPDRVGQWSQGIPLHATVNDVDAPSDSVIGRGPRGRASSSTLGLNNLYGDPPIGERQGRRAQQAMPVGGGVPPGRPPTIGRGQSTARPAQFVQFEDHTVPRTMAEPVLPTPPASVVSRSRRRVPTPYPEDDFHRSTRDHAAAARRGYRSSEAGLTEIDDPVPPYASRYTLAEPLVEEPGDVSYAEQGQAISPDDSISTASRHGDRRVGRRRRSSSSTMSTHSSVSLTDSSVDRVVERLAATGLGGVASSRRTLGTVQEEGATSAKNRKRRSSGHYEMNTETFKSGMKLMVGAQAVRRDSRGNLVLVGRK